MTIPGVSTHARDRMLEHHGRDLTRTEWLGVVLAIIDGASMIVQKASRHASEIHDVAVGSLTLRFVWKPMDAVIATVLPTRDAIGLRAAQVKKSSRIRSSFRKGGGWKRGERRPLRTEWRP